MASQYFLAIIAVSALIIGSNGQIPGGISDISLKHHSVVELVKALPSMSNDLNGLEIVKVVRAQMQVVSGFRYILTVQTRAAGSNGPATQECEASIWVQSWLNKRELTSMKCKAITAAPLFLAGGVSDIDVNHNEVQELLKALPSMSNDLNGLEIVKVVKAKVQVVAGMRYILTIQTRAAGSNGPATQECEADIWVQAWLQKRELTSMKCKPVSAAPVPFVGGLSDIDVNHPDIVDIVKGLPSMSNDLNGLEIVKVVKAQVQIVAGARYVLTIQTRAAGSNGPATQECEASIWVQTWLNKRELTSMKCKPVASAYTAVGGWSKGTINEAVLKSASAGLEVLNNACNCMFRKSIIKVKSVQQKIVSGVMFKITVDIIDSSCRNNEENQGKGLEQCPALENAVPKECEITMVYQPWLSPEHRLISHNCH